MSQRMRRLIVNADDLGVAPEVDLGIVEAFRAGGLSSATIMATGASFAHAVELARAHPSLAVGCHLTLVDGAPAAPPARIPSLLGADGALPRSPRAFLRRLLTGRLRLDELAVEVDAQLDRVRSSGIRLTHVDGHKHVTALPGVVDVVVEACRRHGIPAMRAPFNSDPACPHLASAPRRVFWSQWLGGRALRLLAPRWRRVVRSGGIRTPDRFLGLAFTGAWTGPYLDAVLASVRPGVTELMTHPGREGVGMDGVRTRLRESRVHELRLLVEHLPARLAATDIELVGFGALGRDPRLAAQRED